MKAVDPQGRPIMEGQTVAYRSADPVRQGPYAALGVVRRVVRQGEHLQVHVYWPGVRTCRAHWLDDHRIEWRP